MEEEITISLLRKIEQKYKELNKGKIPKVTVGVISFYEAQIININKKIKEIANETPFENLDIKINTVDRFQGREFDIVIVNLVRNKQNKEVSEHILAFERINVAFSRAKKLLFIVGAQNLYNRLNVTIPSLISNQPVTTTVYANIIKHLQKTECFHYGRDLLTAKQKERIMKATHYNNRNNNSNTRQK